jgi:hypothetical protein
MLESISIQQGDYAVSDFLDTYTFGVNGSQYVPKADADIAALATAAGGNSFCLTTAIGDGTDASGNGNNFTPTSMSDAANGSADTPSLVYASTPPTSPRPTIKALITSILFSTQATAQQMLLLELAFSLILSGLRTEPELHHIHFMMLLEVFRNNLSQTILLPKQLRLQA